MAKEQATVAPASGVVVVLAAAFLWLYGLLVGLTALKVCRLPLLGLHPETRIASFALAAVAVLAGIAGIYGVVARKRVLLHCFSALILMLLAGHLAVFMRDSVGFCSALNPPPLLHKFGVHESFQQSTFAACRKYRNIYSGGFTGGFVLLAFAAREVRSLAASSP